jgi:crossover junction endodeoxyribonuclease RuvC
MIIIGIDPGLSGGIAALDGKGLWIEVCPLPYITDGALSFVDGQRLRTILMDMREGQPATVVIERVSAMPKQGVTSSFNFGVGFGSVLGIVRAFDFPLVFVSPAKWKRDMGLSKDKNASLDKARMLYPSAPLPRKKDEGMAEALLIARWYASTQANQFP